MCFYLAAGRNAGPCRNGVSALWIHQAFDAIALDTVRDKSTKILFKAFAGFAETGVPTAGVNGVFFITDNGIYHAIWNVRIQRYNLLIRIPATEIAEVSLRETQKWYGAYELLDVKDSKDHMASFVFRSTYIYGDTRRAAKSYIQDIVSQHKE